MVIAHTDRTIKVERRLFSVPRFFLERETSYFSKMNGSADQPVELPDVSQGDFKTLLRFLVARLVLLLSLLRFQLMMT